MGDGIKRPQPDLSFDELYRQAQTSAPVLESTGQSILDRLKTRNPEMFEGVVFEMGPLKEPARALEKINTDYGGDPRQIKDLVRGRFIVDTPEQIIAIKQAILEELDVDSIKDKYHEPSSTGYRDLNTKIALENSHIAEIQVQQRDMMRVNKPTHDIMEKIQEIDRLATQENRSLSIEEQFQKKELGNQALELHNAAAHDGNLNLLVKPELREQFSYKGELDTKGSALGKAAETFGRFSKNGGFIAGTAFGTLSGAFTLAAGGSVAQAAEAVYEGVVPYGETQIDVFRGDTQAMKRSATIETTSNIGAAGGALAGAAIGTAIMPGVGTVVGAAVGGIGAGIASGEMTALVYDNFAAIKGRAVDLSSEAAGALNAAARKTATLWNRIAGNEVPNISLTDAFKGLPSMATDDMPPEVASLIELKQSPALFKKQFETLKEDGSLDEVVAYIKDNPLLPEIEPACEFPVNPQKIYTASLSF